MRVWRYTFAAGVDDMVINAIWQLIKSVLSEDKVVEDSDKPVLNSKK